MKKLNLLFTALLLWCCLTATAHDFVAGGIYYNITDATNKTVEVTSGANKYTGSVVIPESVTYKATTYSVASIGYQAFEWCTALTGIEIPNSVTSIGDWAFNWCTALTGIEIPNSVTSIGEYAFNCCTALTSIEFPNSVTSIGDYAFSDCYGLTSIEIPNSVTSIGSSAFSDCYGLTSIEIPNSVTSIGNEAFEDCIGLTNIIVESGNTKYDSRENCNAIIETATNTLVIGCKNTIIPNSVTSIGEYAFYRCTTLTSVVIPNSVTSIESYAFSGCSNLTNIIVESGNTKYDSRENCNAIIETATNTLVVGCKSTIIPNNVTSIGSSAFYGCRDLTNIVIPNSVTSIGNEAFYGCRGLTSIVIPNSVTSIGSFAFNSCTSLTSIVIPNSVTSIGNDAFAYCSGLTSIVIPNSVTSIGDGAFACSSLTSIEIPNSVTSIGNEAFFKCTGLTSVVIGNSVTSIGSFAFNSCTSLTSIVIPNSVTSIGSFAFYSCTGLTSIEIGNSVTSIGNEAFLNCPGLKTVYNFSNLTLSKGSSGYGGVAYYANNVYNVPNGSKEGDFIFGKPNDANTLLYYLGNAAELTLPADYNGENYAIDANVFKGNTTITSVVIPNSVTSIGERAFSSCSNLTSIIVESGNAKYDSRENCNAIIETESKTLIVGCKNTIIPNGVKSIGHDAFYGCRGLTSIEIPKTVTSIGSSAFYGCRDLTNIVIPKSVTSIGDWAFCSCAGLTSIEIPKSVTSLGANAFRACQGLTSVVIPNSVTSIGEGAFQSCTGLTSIEIPNSVTSIGENAFYGTDWYKNQPDGIIYAGKVLYEYKGTMPENSSITVQKGTLGIAGGAFSGCTGLTSIEIPNSVTSIGDAAFQRCSALKTVINLSSLIFSKGSPDYGYVAYYADKVVNAPGDDVVDDFVFSTVDDKHTLVAYFGDATDVTLPDNYNGENYTIGDEAFVNKNELTNVVIPNSVVGIGDSAFSGCSGLTRVDIVDGVNSIGESAFAGCSKLEEIYISNTIESIGDNAFADCNNLFEIEIGSKKVVSANENIFSSDAYNNASLYVPVGRKEFYARVSPWSKFIIREMEFTGIDEVFEELKAEGGNQKGKSICYDLNGRVVENPTNGIYIIDGKKCWVSESND